jgi:hypothetical protein
MASPFDRAIAAAAATHDSVMGDLWTFRPMKLGRDVNAPRAVDPDRAVVQHIRAPYIAPGARAAAGPFYQPGVKPERAGNATSRAAVSLQTSLVPYAIVQGDRIERESDGVLLEVYEVIPSVPGFVRLDLNSVR